MLKVKERLTVKMLQYDDEISHRLGLFTQLDSNNNKSNPKEKYSLRPRSSRRKHESNSEDEGCNFINKTKIKKKQKPAPLSKYRRKNANERERTRMREINQAFETLRKVVPQMALQQQQNEKLTKITTLRSAMKYISTLSEVLSDQPSILSDCAQFDSFLLESDGDSFVLHSDVSDQSITSSDFAIDLSNDSFSTMDFTQISCDLANNLTHFDPFLHC